MFCFVTCVYSLALLLSRNPVDLLILSCDRVRWYNKPNDILNRRRRNYSRHWSRTLYFTYFIVLYYIICNSWVVSKVNRQAQQVLLWGGDSPSQHCLVCPVRVLGNLLGTAVAIKHRILPWSSLFCLQVSAYWVEEIVWLTRHSVSRVDCRLPLIASLCYLWEIY